MHLGRFAPALATLIFNSLYHWAAVNAPVNGAFSVTNTAKDPKTRSLGGYYKKRKK